MVSMAGLTQLPPRFLIPLVTKLIQFAHVLLAWLIPPPLQAVQLAFEGRALSEVMRTACALNIAEALADRPKTAKDLSLVIGAQPPPSAHTESDSAIFCEPAVRPAARSHRRQPTDHDLQGPAFAPAQVQTPTGCFAC